MFCDLYVKNKKFYVKNKKFHVKNKKKSQERMSAERKPALSKRFAMRRKVIFYATMTECSFLKNKEN